MHPNQRSRVALPVVTAGLPVLVAALLLGCGRDEAQAPPKLLRPGLVAASAPPPEPTPEGAAGLPVVHIQAESLVTTGTAGHQAQAFGEGDLQYQWYIQGGSFEGDSTGPAVTWTAGEPGEVRLYCQATNASGKQSVTFVRVGSEAAPQIDRFGSFPPVVTAGKSAHLSWSAKEIKTLTLDPGGVDVTQVSGPGYEVRPTDTTRYTLTATNAAGASVSRTLDLKVVAPPVITAFQVQGGVSIGQSLTVRAEFKGGKGEIRRGGTLLAAGDQGPLLATVDTLRGGDTFTLTVTNEAGDALSRSLSFTPPAPQVQAPAKP